MKKIIAGVLAAASVLSVSATAFAADKTVSKAGDITYDVAVTAPKIVLSLTMPAKMSAALNPYGADIVLAVNDDEAKTTVTNGIASAAYKVSNKSMDYGVYIDATATTTVTTTDKTKWTVAAAAPTDGTKGAQLALIGDNTIAALKTAAATVPTANKAATAAAQGCLVMDSTAKDKGLAAGGTQQKKVFYLKAATDAETPTDMYMGLYGALAKSTTTADVVWNEDDAINVNLILKVSAGGKTFA